jgi:hypothetical protein
MRSHIEVSTTYFRDISASVDSNAERLADLAVQSHNHHTQARGWHEEETEKLEEVISGISILKEEGHAKENGTYLSSVYFPRTF